MKECQLTPCIFLSNIIVLRLLIIVYTYPYSKGKELSYRDYTCRVLKKFKGKYRDGQKTAGDKTGMDCTQWIATHHRLIREAFEDQ